MNKLGKININNINLYTFNGVHPEEKRLGQRLEIDVEMTYPIENNVRNDDLKETVSYSDVFKTVEKFVNSHSYNLIESVANHLLSELLQNYPTLEHIKLRIRKYSAPIAGIFDNVEIEVEGGRDNGRS
ncbi:dihydroneopterin aldolase [Pediococcus claussenii ATCC BAA-344]|uniref:7,8-dihydroneopterin aldolase n=1 Tax=Pediococcus claussenii (strain ATCC BAA-344 / DSM 14800 / JCM 18046 / KCTC 3811 / LMG 21948 / P06) TaxID=701521 RepID=G8PDL7_PEDCP|nr:dihydroneopterin aldolase [Pediococcus claussenii ATCC BAA-344]KRN18995.1 folB protein [Pediococcus claussenii]